MRCDGRDVTLRVVWLTQTGAPKQRPHKSRIGRAPPRPALSHLLRFPRPVPRPHTLTTCMDADNAENMTSSQPSVRASPFQRHKGSFVDLIPLSRLPCSQILTYIKPEPRDTRLNGLPSGSALSTLSNVKSEPVPNPVSTLSTHFVTVHALICHVKLAHFALSVKPEPAGDAPATMHDVIMQDVPQVQPVQELATYSRHVSVHKLDYTPEAALKEGAKMVQIIRENIKKLELGSKLRKDVWMREVERYVRVLAHPTRY